MNLVENDDEKELLRGTPIGMIRKNFDNDEKIKMIEKLRKW